MTTLDLTLDELCAMRKELKMALFSGAKKIRHNDRETEFHSVQQMQRVLDQLDREINCKSGVSVNTVINPVTTY